MIQLVSTDISARNHRLRSIRLSFRYFAIILALLSITAGVCLGALVVCGKCGYENESTRPDCSHCAAALPEPAPDPELEPESTDPLQDERDMARDALIALVKTEARLAGSYAEKRDYGLAWFLYRNAAAIESILDTPDTSRAKRLYELVGETRAHVREGREQCEICKGTGIKSMRGLRTGDQVVRAAASGQKCTGCAGVGYRRRRVSIAQYRIRVGWITRQYVELQQSRKYVRVSEAWVPADMVGGLTARQRASLAVAVALPCRDCAGVGRSDCRKCSGAATVKCGGDGCDGGKVDLAAEERLIGTGLVTVRDCDVCVGKGVVRCPACKGGSGTMCKRCNGTGEREMCSKCVGQGVDSCRRCRGTGLYKDRDCAWCKGEGVTLCTRCKGDGRGR